VTGVDHFPEDYFEAQRRFQQAVERTRGELIPIPIEARGPSGEALAIDVGWFGSSRPRRVLVHSCGVHGVEAFAGSAIQLAWLESPPPSLDESQAIVLVHPVNPSGMAWRRRVNGHNVDLNRNCLRPGETYAGAPDGYRALDAFLNPTSMRTPDLFLPRAIARIARFGLAALKQAIAAGQYEYPAGLFFGGRALEEEPRRLLALMRERLWDAEDVTAIDVHTGLGRFGQDTYLVDAAIDAPALARLRAEFGARLAPLDPRRGPAYTPRGLYETIFQLAAPRATPMCVGQEFGTHSALAMLGMLRRENYEFHHVPGGVTAATARALGEAFVPTDATWRAQVVQRGVDAIRRLTR
jgi:hypothetical protein